MLYKREILSQIGTHVSQKEITLLTGARQTGKTTVLRQLEGEIKGSTPTFFLNLENLEFVKLLNQSPEELFKIFPLNKKTRKRQVVLIDEIQYLENPTNFLKYIYDEYAESVKLIASGSSAFYLDKKFKDSLAGRKKIFSLYPLSLRDFFIFKGRSDLLEYIPKAFSLNNISLSEKLPVVFKRELATLFQEFMIYGGYPRVVLAESSEQKRDILEELATSYIKKDILEADLKEEEKYYDLFKILSSQIGGQINTNELANTLNMSRPTINHYLHIMRKSFHFALIRPFSQNKRKEIRKMPKGYFYDVGLRNYFINNFNVLEIRQDPGQLLENIVFKQFVDKMKLDDIAFWRTTQGEEVDFIIQEKAAFEVKYHSSGTGLGKSKYAAFTKRYKDMPLHFISYVVQQEDKGKVWEPWFV